MPPASSEPLGENNKFMKMHAVSLVEKGLKQVRKIVYEEKVTIMGPAYKENIDNLRESSLPIKIIEGLRAKVRVYVPYLRTCAGEFTSAKNINEALDGADCALFLTDHDVFREILLEDMKEIMASPVIVNGKNMFDGGERIVYLGIGKGISDLDPQTA